LYTYLHSIIQLFLLLTIIFKNCILIVVFLKCYISMRRCAINLERGDTVQVTMPKPYIKYKIISSCRSWDNCYVFDIWFLYGDLYRVSPFQVYRTFTSCLQCDLEFFMFAVMKTFVTVISASTGRSDCNIAPSLRVGE
jgi:hypothetical protein